MSSRKSDADIRKVRPVLHVLPELGPPPPRAASFAPTAMDVPAEGAIVAPGPPAEAEETTAIVRRVLLARRKKLALVVGGIVGAAALVLVLAGARHALSAPEAAEARVTAADPVVAPAPVARENPAPMPASPAAPAPTITMAPSGTIIVPGERQFVVDGVVVHASSAIVSCGRHAVKIGRTPHTVDVPCGGEVRVR